jgi:hypothetical protein
MLTGSKAPNATVEDQVRISIALMDHSEEVSVLRPSTKTVGPGHRYIAALAVGGGDTFSLPLGGTRFLVFIRPGSAHPYWDRPGAVDTKEESLGMRRIGGVDTIGRRVTVTIPIGQAGNNQPIDIVDERWQSPDLRIVIEARDMDPRNGTMEYRLSNIRLTAPDPSLFVIPEGYVEEQRNDRHWISVVFADNVRPKRPTIR